jgi:hypothetical protein
MYNTHIREKTKAIQIGRSTMTHNAYDISYDYYISDDAEELAYNIWEANRVLAIAKATGDKKLERNMKAWLVRLGYSLQDSTADITFTV